jgi:hypothetical protein
MTYSSATHPPDTEVANYISAALKRRDLKRWIAPRDITPGAHYASEIVHAIDSAKAIVLVSTVRVRSYPRWLLARYNGLSGPMHKETQGGNGGRAVTQEHIGRTTISCNLACHESAGLATASRAFSAV